MKKLMAIGLISVALTGCAAQRFVVNGNAEPTDEEMQWFFVGGIGQTQTMNAAAICGGAERVGMVEASYQGFDWIIGALSGGIVTPRTSKVGCL